MGRATTKAPSASQLPLFDLDGMAATPTTATPPSTASATRPRRKPAAKPTGADRPPHAAEEPAAAGSSDTGDLGGAVSLLDADDADQSAVADCLAKALARGAIRSARAQTR
jgi:hypothetical protein